MAVGSVTGSSVARSTASGNSGGNGRCQVTPWSLTRVDGLRQPVDVHVALGVRSVITAAVGGATGRQRGTTRLQRQGRGVTAVGGTVAGTGVVTAGATNVVVDVVPSSQNLMGPVVDAANVAVTGTAVTVADVVVIVDIGRDGNANGVAQLRATAAAKRPQRTMRQRRQAWQRATSVTTTTTATTTAATAASG